ncbi:MAG: biotin-dependent carboxyltransferase family protein [Cytophagales bacterium]|nr:biotin-dependent carboxyltransferase family protein [Cytophagales bacterium]
MNLTIGMEVLEIISPGIHSSIQDRGRFGQRGYAIPQSGCLDNESHFLANYLVGNAPDIAIVEIIGGRFEGKILGEAYLGIVCTKVNASVNGERIPTHETIRVFDTDLLKIENSGLTYLAIDGGVEGQSHFGSSSTYPLAKLGGMDGNILKKGDRLSASVPNRPATKYLPEQVLLKSSGHQVIRILKGPEFERVKIKKSDFEKKIWKISTKSNRMGIRLEGSVVESIQTEMKSVPTFPGTIQLTNEGLPIVLMVDSQTTGGYPRIGQVIMADLPRLGRMILAGTIKFKFVDISEARYIQNQKETFLKHALD